MLRRDKAAFGIDDDEFKGAYRCCFDDADYYVKCEGGKECFLQYLGERPKIILPDNIEMVGSFAFEDNRRLQAVVLPENLEVVDEFAFLNCVNLRAVKMYEGITTIGDGAFQNCKSLTGINFPFSLRDIGEEAFKGCAELVRVTIKDSVEDIGVDAFANCRNLERVVFIEPKFDVEEVLWNCFSGCDKLEKEHISIID